MLESLALIWLVGLCFAWVCGRLGLPRLVGMLIAGMVLGNCGFDLLSDTMLSISSEVRTLALALILLKAGLSLNLGDLRKVGRSAALMSFLPATFEVLAYALFAPMILGITPLEGALMGAVLGAVSPAVVVPKMVELMENRYGTGQSIPQMILAGASLDDVYTIVVFTSVLSMLQGGGLNVAAFGAIPVSIVLGVGIGILCGVGLCWLWKCITVTVPVQVVSLIAMGCGLVTLEDLLSDVVAMSGLLAVMSMGCVLGAKHPQGANLSKSFGGLWEGAQVLLFVLVGAAVDLPYAMNAGVGVIAMIALSLAIRACGVWLCVLGTTLKMKERLFCVIAYLPKATVQAAIGGVPLAMGLGCGELVLTVAVVAILITAPLGALGMEVTYQKWLQKEE
ncbi:cation:proton antiporter [Bengtsoniella intestinalis]|uniref:cation:proton antiporter domain-containing protein n=1 Tax=Bengtsoniella intestinalis TaxID=3073143 RepID=UPI00391F66E6